jgi:hypothetical protein
VRAQSFERALRTELATTAVPTLTTTRFASLSLFRFAGDALCAQRRCQPAAESTRRAPSEMHAGRLVRMLVSQSYRRAPGAGGREQSIGETPEKARVPAAGAPVKFATRRRAPICITLFIPSSMPDATPLAPVFART